VGNLVIPAGSTANVVVGTGGLISARGGDSAIVPYTPTYSHWFNGYSTYDYLTVTNTAYPFSLSGDFTVEAWIYLNAYGSTYTSIVDTRTGAVAQTWNFGVYGTGLDFYWGASRATSSMRVPSGQWTHVAATRQSGNVYLYVNGYRDATSVTGVTTWMQQTSTTVWIGNNRDGAATGQNTYSANVYISNLRTVSGIAVYTGNFTPQTTNLSTTQSSGANIAAISSSPTLVNTGLFNGTTSYLLHTYAANGPMDLATGQPSWTVECWFYCTNYAAKQTTIFDASGRVGVANSALAFWLSATGVGAWIIGNGGGLYIAYVPTMATTFALGTWYHVAMVRNTSTGRAQVYVNGVLDANSNIVTSGNMGNAYSLDFSIGSDIATQLAGTALFYGYISNLRAVKGVAVYTGNFTVPSIPLTVTQSSSGNIAAISGSQTSLLILQGTPIADASLNSISITNSAVTMTQLVVGIGTTFLSLQNSTLIDNSIANSPIVKYYGSVSPSIFSQSTPVTDGYASVYFNGATLLQYTNSTATTSQYPAVDASNNAFLITPTGSPTANVAAPSIAPLSAVNSISFNGSTQYLTVPNSTAITLDTGDFTIEAWVYTTVLNGQNGIFGKREVGQFIGVIFRVLNTTNKLVMQIANTSGTSWAIDSNLDFGLPALTTNTWYHVALVRSGSSFRIYQNGVGGTVYTYAGTISHTTAPGYIGKSDGASGNQFWNGYISNFRVTKGVAVYTGNFTVPAAPLTITQSSSGANIAAITGSQTSLLVQATNGWTAECWVYPSGDYSVYRTIFAKRVSASATTEFEGYLRLTTGVIGFYNGTTSYESTTTLTANTWSHCAWVYTGTNIVIYVNGTQVYTSAVTITTNTEPLVIGGARGYSEYFLGYLSNFRFTRGMVYTGAFTPHTRPLAATQTATGNIAAITGNASSRTNLLVLQSSTYKDNSATNYLYGYTYTINTGTPLIKIDVTPFVDPQRGVIAYGGGAGGFNDSTNNATTGGSSGGSWNPGYTPASSSQPTISYYNGTAYPNTGFGNTGGTGGGDQPYGGGGGGAGAAGYAYNGIVPGGGGNGRQYTISGAPVYYAGGGSSAGYYLNAGYMINPPGLGGGGTGDNSPNASRQQPGGYTTTTSTVYDTANGAPYTGGGGGSGGYGGSGIVVMRYLGTQIATGGTVTSIGGYTIHTFTTAGTFTIAANISVGSTGGNGGPYAGGGGGAAGYLGFGGNGAVGTALAAGNYGIGGGGGGGGSSATFGGGGGGVDLWGLGGYSGAGGAAGQPGTGGSAEVILGITGNGAQPGFGSNGGLYGGGGGGGVTSSLDTSQGWGANGAFALVYSTTSSTYTYPYISPLNLVYLGNLQSTNTTQFTSNVSGVITDSKFDQNVIGDLAYSQTSVNMSVAYDSPNTNNTVSVYRTASLAANNVVASDITVTVDYQVEWMLRNSDPAFPATYDKPFNYQYAQPITTTNDPRKLTLKASFITKTGTQQDTTEPDQYL
jgi:hypothetical protein